MHEGRDRSSWWHTASIEATIANVNRDSKKRRRPYRATEFHPWEELDRKKRREREGRDKADVSILKAVFVDRKTFTQIEEEFDLD